MLRSTRNAVNLLAVDLREDGEEIGEAAVRDPHLLAVEDVVPARPRVSVAVVLRGQRVGPDCGSVSA